MAEEENPEDTPEDEPEASESAEDDALSDEPEETASPESESESEQERETTEEPIEEEPSAEELMEMTVEGDDPEPPDQTPDEPDSPSPPEESEEEEATTPPPEQEDPDQEPADSDESTEESPGQAEETAEEDPEEPEAQEDLEEGEEETPTGQQQPDEEIPPEEEGDLEGEELTEESEESDEDSGSIEDMLQEESRRAQQEEDLPEATEEEELPGGYLTVDQLPEEEEFAVPDWVKYAGYSLLGVFFVYLSTSFLLLPLWENYHVMQIQSAVQNENYNEAENLMDRGMLLGGVLIHYPDPFVADYLKSLLDAGRYDHFQRVYRGYVEAGIRGPRMDQMYTQFLLNRGKWEEALPRTEQLQTQSNTEVRGFGYLFRARALLELRRLEDARDILDQARLWLSDHVEVVRVERDLLIYEENFERAFGCYGFTFEGIRG